MKGKPKAESAPLYHAESEAEQEGISDSRVFKAAEAEVIVYQEELIGICSI